MFGVPNFVGLINRSWESTPRSNLESFPAIAARRSSASFGPERELLIWKSLPSSFGRLLWHMCKGRLALPFRAIRHQEAEVETISPTLIFLVRFGLMFFIINLIYYLFLNFYLVISLFFLFVLSLWLCFNFFHFTRLFISGCKWPRRVAHRAPTSHSPSSFTKEESWRFDPWPRCRRTRGSLTGDPGHSR